MLLLLKRGLFWGSCGQILSPDLTTISSGLIANSCHRTLSPDAFLQISFPDPTAAAYRRILPLDSVARSRDQICGGDRGRKWDG